jgi:glycosyltransferase involved in cell wall biosynthesis
MQKTNIVIPCYNEAARLPTAEFSSYLESHADVGFVLVDDGSEDATYDVLTSLAAAHPSAVHVLKLERNSGKAEAVRRGMLMACDLGADFVGYWDADLATPLRFIDVFAKHLSETDAVIVLGSRVRLLGRDVERSTVRHYIGRCFATIASLALKMPVYDTQCGAKLLRASPGVRQLFEQPFELGWTFDVELFARLLRLAQREAIDPGRQFVEWPLDEWHDAPGSKLRPAHFARIAWELTRLFGIARRGPDAD